MNAIERGLGNITRFDRGSVIEDSIGIEGRLHTVPQLDLNFTVTDTSERKFFDRVKH